METTRIDRLFGIVPFRYQGSFRIFPVQHVSDIAPDGRGRGFVFVIVFDQGIGHVHAEPVASPVQPEAHDFFHRFPCRNGFRGIDSTHPFLGPVQPAIVQSRLGREEIEHIGTIPFSHTGDIRMAADAFKRMRCPDISAAVFIRLIL